MIKARRRLWIIASGAVVLALAATLAGVALRDTMVFFYSPSMVSENPPQPGQRVRVGGLVVHGSVDRPGEGGANFTVTDGRGDIRIEYAGSLPDLFREGQGIVAEGLFGEMGVFTADRVLAKHDETYMPPEVAEALRQSGLSMDDEGYGGDRIEASGNLYRGPAVPPAAEDPVG